MMTETTKPKLIESKLISAILPKGVALDVIKKLRTEKDINTAHLNYARGTGKLTPLKYRESAVEREKEILTVIVESSRSDEIFEFIYDEADINKPHGGLMHMHTLMLSSEYTLPDVTEEET